MTLASLVLSTMGVAAAQQRPRGGAEAERPPSARPDRARTDRRPAKLQPAQSEERVEFSFEDAALPELVQFVARVTGRRFILSGDARALRVTIVTESPVTPAEVYSGFLSVLAMHGMTVVRSGRYYRIVETDGIAGEAVPVVTDGETAPRGDVFLTRMHRVAEGSVEDAAGLLAQFSSPGGSVTTHAPTRTLILTDTAANIRRMLSILDELEPPEPDDRIYVERLRHADAAQTVQTLNELMPGAPTKLVAIP